MNIDEIKKRVAEIDAIKDDPEKAHISERALMDDFIKHIADNGPADLAEMAKEVLKTWDIDFHRWSN